MSAPGAGSRIEDPGRVRRLLAAGAFALTALAMVVSLRAAVAAVRGGSDDLLRAETATAVALLSTVGEPRTRALFGDRLVLDGAVQDGLDRPVVRGDTARAARYDADGWNVVGTVRLGRRPETGSGVPPWLVLLALVGSLALGVLAWHATGPAERWDDGPARGALASGLGAALVLFVVVAGAQLWSRARLAALSELRLAAAAQALGTAGLDTGASAPEDAASGTVTRITGLPLLRIGPDGRIVATTLLPVTADALARGGAEGATPATAASTRVVVDAVPYRVRDAGPFRLSMIPYEHTRNALAVMVGVALAGLLLAALPLTLVPLVDRPRELRRNLLAWGFLAPAATHLAIFTLGPLMFAAWLSLHRWNLVDVARPFVGAANYLALLEDGSFWNALRNTAVLTLHVPVAMAVALGFALLVHRRTRTVALVRAALFLPSITSLVAIAVVWQWILNADYGILNWVLGLVGIGPVRWLTSPKTALLSIMILSVWLVVGYQMVLFQAGLAAIPEELYDAARIDGASVWRRFWHVTLPGLRHTLFFVLVTSIIGSFQIFGAVYVMTEGGPLGATDVAVYHIYKEAWEFLRFGNAAAQSWVLFAVIFVVTWLHFRFLERRQEPEMGALSGPGAELPRPAALAGLPEGAS